MPPERLRHSGAASRPRRSGRRGPAGRARRGSTRRGRRRRPGDEETARAIGGQRAHQVLDVDRAERRPGRVAELADDQPAAGPGHPAHLAQAGERVDDVAQPERDRDRVEGVVGERQPGPVAGGERQVRAGPSCRPGACRARSRTAPRSRRGRRTAGSTCRCRRPGRGPGRPAAGRRRRSRPCASGGPGPGRARRWSRRSGARRRRTCGVRRSAACRVLRGPRAETTGAPCARAARPVTRHAAQPNAPDASSVDTGCACNAPRIRDEGHAMRALTPPCSALVVVRGAARRRRVRRRPAVATRWRVASRPAPRTAATRTGSAPTPSPASRTRTPAPSTGDRRRRVLEPGARASRSASSSSGCSSWPGCPRPPPGRTTPPPDGGQRLPGASAASRHRRRRPAHLAPLLAMTKRRRTTRCSTCSTPDRRSSAAGDQGDAVRDLQARLESDRSGCSATSPARTTPTTVEAVKRLPGQARDPGHRRGRPAHPDRLHAMTRRPTHDAMHNSRRRAPTSRARSTPRCRTGRVLCVDKTSQHAALGRRRARSPDRRRPVRLATYSPTREGLFHVYRKDADHVSHALRHVDAVRDVLLRRPGGALLLGLRGRAATPAPSHGA